MLGVLALIGGVFALMHRRWRLALTGAAGVVPLPFAIIAFAAWARYFHNIPSQSTYALATLLAFFPIVLLILSRKQFK
jgi:hypothetical protein